MFKKLLLGTSLIGATISPLSVVSCIQTISQEELGNYLDTKEQAIEFIKKHWTPDLKDNFFKEVIANINDPNFTYDKIDKQWSSIQDKSYVKPKVRQEVIKYNIYNKDKNALYDLTNQTITFDLLVFLYFTHTWERPTTRTVQWEITIPFKIKV